MRFVERERVAEEDRAGARKAELGELVDLVRGAAAGAPQHVMLLGAPGMGKTALLAALEHRIGGEPALSRQWLPVRLDEPQYHLGSLADFWLEVLAALASITGRPELADEASALAATLPPEALEEAARTALSEAAQELERRLLLLVDRLDLVLERVDGDVDASRLREVLQHDPWIMLVGASSRSIEATYDYEQPFYDLFHVLPLAPLSSAAAAELVRSRAQDLASAARWLDEPHRWRLLHQLSGGSPRTLLRLIEVWRLHPDAEPATSLARVLELDASAHRELMAGLPRQAQRVFDALLRSWDPTTAEAIAAALRLERGVVSGQLHRLVARGLAEKVAVPGRALGFQVRDRALQLWYLSAHRRGRDRLEGLLAACEALVAATEAEAASGIGSGAATNRQRVARADPAQYATDLAERAEAGDEAAAFEARGAARDPLERAPDDPAVQLAVCRIEVRLGRRDAALAHWSRAVTSLGPSLGSSPAAPLRALRRLVGMGAAADALDALAPSQAGVWGPLQHALALLSERDAARATRLAPEMRALVEMLRDFLAA